jgi:hypothetical protein
VVEDSGNEPFDPQAGNTFVKWLLYRNDTPILDALTNDRNLKAAQDVAAGVTIIAATIATGGAAAKLAVGAGLSTTAAGAVGGYAATTVNLSANASYQGRDVSFIEATTTIGIGTLTGGVGGALASSASGAGFGRLATGAIAGGGAASFQVGAESLATGKDVPLDQALKSIALGAAIGLAFSASSSVKPKLNSLPNSPKKTSPTETKVKPGMKPTIEFRIPKEAFEKVPKGWKAKPAKDGIGVRFSDPSKGAKSNNIRIDQGDPNSEYETNRDDHVHIQSKGKVMGKSGEAAPDPKIDKNGFEMQRHIPLEDWKNWVNWDKANGRE